MGTSPLTVALSLGLLVVAVAAAAALLLLPRARARRRRLRDLATLLRATDPRVRTESLERVHALAARDRVLLSKLLRGQLLASRRGGGPAAGAQAATVWLIRQVLMLLSDPRTAVRTDAARVLRVIIRVSDREAGRDADQPSELAAPVRAAVELAGRAIGRQAREGARETRVLAFAEMLEAGLRPLAVGLQALEGVEQEALEPLTSALRERSPRVRRSLYEVLAAMGGDRAVELLTLALEDPSPELRAQAARSLGQMKAISAASRLAQLLKDPMAEVRSAAASALGEVGLDSFCGPVLEALIEECRRDDGAEAARAAMTDAVARLADGAREALTEALASLPRSLAFRLATACEQNGAIARWLGQPAEAGGRGEQGLADLLARLAEVGVSRPFREALDSTEQWVRLRAAAALGHSPETAALAAVVSLLSDPDTSVRAEVARSVARAGQPVGLRALARAASDPDRSVRLAATHGLWQVLARRSSWRREGLPSDFDLEVSLAESQRALLLATRDSDESVRAEAAEALSLLASGEAAEALVALALDDGSGTVREAATKAVGRCGFPQVRRLLAAALEDRQETRRERAMAILGALGGPQAQRDLVEGLHDVSPRVREAALSALSGLEAGDMNERLVSELRNPDSRVRAGVAAQLGRARAVESADGLAQALADPEEEVRVNALQALAALGRPVRRHESALTARLSDPSARVREAAGAALEGLRAVWAEPVEGPDLVRGGPLTASSVAALVAAATGGDLSPLLRALENRESAQSVAAFLAGPGRARMTQLLSSLRQADERDQQRALGALARALRQGGGVDGYLVELRAVDSEVRLMAVEMAGLLATPDAISGLVEVLRRDPLPEVRSRAASVLGEASGAAVEAALLRSQEEDPNQVVKLVASHALNRVRGLPQEGPGLPPTVGRV